MSGTVHLVGAGPGAADLLTLRAARLLGQADVVFHDALVPREVLDLVLRGKTVAVGKRSGRLSTAQTFINKQLLDAAKRYKIVVRLKGGDPMLFGRAHEEIEFLLRHGVPVEVVPGVTAALAASADLRTSLTRRGVSRSVAFVTPRVAHGSRASSWVPAVMAADTAAIYMGAGESEAIAKALLDAGKPAATPVAIVESASTPQIGIRYGTLAALAGLNAGEGPTLILLGEVYAEAVEAAGRLARNASQAA